ncbi:MAG TPA: peptidoglycan-associated lipoprotein, partial [Croceibacterium sp.]|nr:peptidoglycan-associated lipoprotein [Croceibacterium sp.]
LAALGVDPGRLSVMSYGKERPAALGSDEESWAQNRRAVTVTID